MSGRDVPALPLPPFRLDALLAELAGTGPFRDYCDRRGIAPPRPARGAAGWAEALGCLAPAVGDGVLRELALVEEMADPAGNARLVQSAGTLALPPPSVPGGAPLALWFLLEHERHFHAVAVGHSFGEADAWRAESWRVARAAPGLAVADLPGKAKALAAAVGASFAARDGTGRFCCARGHRSGRAAYFTVRVAGRPAPVEGFTSSGRTTSRVLVPAQGLLFAYDASDGAVLLRSPRWSRARTAELLDGFGGAVLGSPVAWPEPTFDLEALKEPFHPPADAADVLGVRLKALHLRYPARQGGRIVKFETPPGDRDDAIDRLLAAHVAGPDLAELRVCHAEVLVRLRVGGAARPFPIRLWPDRCSLGGPGLDPVWRARLRRWRLLHGG